MTVTRFCFIRHGETAWNTQRRLQGQLDIGLNENGEGQARAVGRWLARRGGIDVIHSSDLSRAWRTAGHVGMALGLTPLPAPGLRERRYGVFEGLTYTDAREWHPEHYARLEAREPDFVIPDGESLRQFHDRVTAGLEALLERHRGQTLVVVVHGGVLDIINRFVRGNSLSAPRDFLIPNTGLNWVVQDRDGWHIEAWGEIPHLEAGALDELR